MNTPSQKVRFRSLRQPRAASRGFSLVELMVAMLLGLIVIGGVISVFLSNQQVYRTSEALGDVENGTRIAFELMARDLRSAGLTGCNKGERISNVLNTGPNGDGTDWWATMENSLHGYAAGDADPALDGSNQVSNTESLQVVEAAYTGLSVDTNDQMAGTFTLNEVSDNLSAGDVLIVCDQDHAAIFQSTGYTAATKTIDYATGGSPGNFTIGLGYPTSTSSAASTYTFGTNAMVAMLSANDWYIGTNPDGGTSLYRMSLSNSAGAVSPTSQEMVRGVSAMAIRYHQSGGNEFVEASSVTNWGAVDAVQVTLTVESVDQRAGTNAKPISRTFTSTTTLRNRVS